MLRNRRQNVKPFGVHTYNTNGVNGLFFDLSGRYFIDQRSIYRRGCFARGPSESA